MYEFDHWSYSCVGLDEFQMHQLYYDHTCRIIPILTGNVCFSIYHLFFFEHLMYQSFAFSVRYCVEKAFELLCEASRGYLVGYNTA